MFRRTIFVGIFLLLLSGVALFFLLVPCRLEDRRAYAELLQESTAIHARHTLESDPIEQWREGVQKEIWTEGRTCCFTSEKSYVLIGQRKGCLTICEEMEHVKGMTTEGKFQADYGSYKERKVVLTGKVQFESEDLFGIANQLTYDLEKEQALLTSHPPERVLFWEKGMALSAPQVAIDREERLVRGIGDVRFSFNLEEKKKLSQIFSTSL